MHFCEKLVVLVRTYNQQVHKIILLVVFDLLGEYIYIQSYTIIHIFRPTVQQLTSILGHPKVHEPPLDDSPYVPGSFSTPYIGDGHRTLNDGNPYNGPGI